VLYFRLDNRKFANIYIPSYARMGPYVVGLLTGYLLYRLKCKCKIPLVRLTKNKIISIKVFH